MAVRVSVYGTANMTQITKARRELDLLEAKANATAGGFVASMGRFGSAASTAGAAMASAGSTMTSSLTVPLVALGVGLYKATNAAAEDAQQQVLLANALRNSAGATNLQVRSTESWITAQGKALGVADDQLRPALATLVGATHDVTKAQTLATLSMDIAAAKNIDVEVAAKAVAKAYAGNATSLSRLLPGIDAAALKSKDFGKIMDATNKIVGGQAAAAANTEAGARQKANVALSEAVESLGTSFLPIMTQATNFLTNKVVPALTKVADWFSKLDTNTKSTIVQVGLFVAAAGPLLMITGKLVQGVGATATGIAWVGKQSIVAAGGMRNFVTGLTNASAGSSAFATPMMRLGGLIRTAATNVWGFITSLGAKIGAMAVSTGQWIANAAAVVAHKAATIASSVATKAAAAGQWLLNAAMTANPIGLVIAAVAALVAGLTWFFTQTKVGQEIWSNFTNFLTQAWSNVTSFLSQAWKNITKFFQTAMNFIWKLFLDWTIYGWVIKNFGAIVNFFQTSWSNITTFFSNAMGRITSAVTDGIGNVVSWFKKLPSTILGLLDGAGRWLYDVGRNVIDGLWNGLKNTWGNVMNWVGGLFNGFIGKVKNLLGIASPSRVFAGIGENVGLGFANGIVSMTPLVEQAAATMAGKAGEKARSVLQAIGERTAQIAGSFQIGQMPTAGEEATPQSIADALAAQVATKQGFIQDLAVLKSLGLNKTTLDELLKGGVGQYAGVADALAGMSKSEIGAYNLQVRSDTQASKTLATMELSKTKWPTPVQISQGAVQVTVSGSANVSDVTQAVTDAFNRLTRELRSA